MSFPTSPSEGQVYQGYKYNSSLDLWEENDIYENVEIDSLDISTSNIHVEKRLEDGYFSAHYGSAVILLIPYYSGTLIDESEVVGRFSFRRGSAGASNRLEVLDMAAKTAYNNTSYTLNRLHSSWGWDFHKCLYNSKWWLCIQSGDNVQDSRWEFWGKRICSSHLGYDPNDQFRFIEYYNSEYGGIKNSEVYNSLEAI